MTASWETSATITPTRRAVAPERRRADVDEDDEERPTASRRGRGRSRRWAGRGADADDMDTVAIVVKSSVGMSREPTQREEVGDAGDRGGRDVGHTWVIGGRARLHERQPRSARPPAGRGPPASPPRACRAARGRERDRRAAAARTRARARAGAAASSRASSRLLALVPDQVEVERARTPAHVAHAAELGLDREQHVQQLRRRERRVERRDGVREVGLAGGPDRRGAVDGRARTAGARAAASAAAAARSVAAGSPRFAPNPT